MPEILRGRAETAGKALFSAFVVAIFVKLFLFTPQVPHASKFELFEIQTLPYPGADARNIQMAAHCARQGVPYFARTWHHECLGAAAPVRAHHPMAIVPVLNYPSLWPRLYGLFQDDSEDFFIAFWRLNAVLLAAGLAVLCCRYRVHALPLLLFSPVAMLAVERGNVDATTFFVTFVPLLLFSGSVRLQSFFVGLAGALKIFPAAGWLAFARSRRPPFLARDALVGGAVALPLVVMSCLELPELLRGTGRGVQFSYGLLSLRRLPVVEDHALLGFALVGLVLAAMLAAAGLALQKRSWRESLRRDVARIAAADLTLLLVSLAIFLSTFLLFTNWAYRLIFLAPAFLMLSGWESALARAAALTIAVLLWIPLVPDGWLFLNLLCYPLAILLAGVAAVAWAEAMAPRRESAV